VPPKKQRTPELRARLLAAAIEVLAEGGVAAVTTRAVAARAGTTAPAIYELFTDKAGLIRAMFFDGFARLGRAFEELPEPSGTPEEIVAFARVFRAFAQTHPRLFEVMYSRPFSDFRPAPEEQALGDTTRAALVDRVQACVDAGTLAGEPADIAHAVLALTIGLATQETAGWLGSSDASRSRRWAAAVRALLEGFAPP